MNRLRLVPVVVALIASVLPAATGSANPSTQSRAATSTHGRTLSARTPVVRFHGKFHNPTPLPSVNNPLPAGCHLECQTWTFRAKTQQPFLVAVKNHNGSMDDGINLFVNDPTGKQVASADGIGANGQSVAIAHPKKGVYTAQVTVTYAYDPVTAYRGEARLMKGRSWHVPPCHRTRCALLPRLRAAPASDMHITGLPPVASTPLGFPFPFGTPTDNSCYLDETADSGVTRCLRFTSNVLNVGAGQLHLSLPWLVNGKKGPKSGFLPGQCKARQLIDHTDGTTTGRKAGPCEFHPAHGHFHYRPFVSYGLYAVTKHHHTGKLVGQSKKESFCLADDDYRGYGRRSPNGPRGYAGQPDCNVPHAGHASSAHIGMGLNPGWGDVYTWDTPDQFIDISKVPAGTYDVIIKTNPSKLMRVAGPARVCSRTRIHLTKNSVKTRSTRSSVQCPHLGAAG